MKKILVITIAIFLLIPVSNAFAYTGGLLNGKQLNIGNSHTNTLTYGTNMTDNNEATSDDIGYNASNTDVVWYEFSQEMNLTHYQFKANAVASDYYIKYYNSVDSEIFVQTPNIDGIKASKIVGGVKKIAVYNNNPNSRIIYEFDVFGYPTNPTIEHLPVTNLTETHNHNTVNLSWENPSIAEFTGTIIKQNGVEVAQLANNTSSYSINNLDAETTYNFEVIAKYSDSVNSIAESIQVVTEVQPVDDLAPSDISSLMVEKTDTTASFIYSLPIDTDFSHIDIYRNGALLKTGHTLNTFDDVALVPNTSYVYKFVSVDASGNQSNGYTQTVLTNAEVDNQAPTAPTGVVTANGNGGGTVTWDSSTDTDLNGYNVFVNGTKHNTTLIKATTYVVPNLTNDETYQITVSAVDTSGNESLQSEISTITPNKSEMPVYQMKYSLKDVADGTSSWFGSIWLILAFSVAIPLTFLVARRIKDLFLA